MAEIDIPSRMFSLDGAESLARALEQALVADADQDLRRPQMRALEQSLHQLSQDLGHEAERMSSRLETTPEIEAFSVSLRQLADTFAHLWKIAQTNPSGG